MGFKENLKTELEYKDMKVKELAFVSGVNKRTIDQYLSSAAKMPSAENAVKIATVLGVTVEYLVTGKNPSFLKSINSTKNSSDISNEIDNQVFLYKKYHSLIQKAEKLSKEQICAIENLMELM